MLCKQAYKTPEGFDGIMMISDGEVLTGLYFINSRDQSKHNSSCEEKDLPIFRQTSRWLDIYFSGRQPDFTPAYKIQNLTPFRKEVLDIMLSIPFGKTLTYGEIAKQLADAHGIKKMSAQAVGGAVGWNPICIIIPCHGLSVQAKTLQATAEESKTRLHFLNWKEMMCPVLLSQQKEDDYGYNKKCHYR